MIAGYNGIALEPIRIADSDLLFSWRNHPDIWQFTRQYEPLTEEQHKTWLIEHQKDPSIKMYLVTHNGGASKAGVCGLTSIDYINSRAEGSLYIAPEFQGNGFGLDAWRTLIDHAFLRINLHLIWFEVFANNTKSIDMFENRMELQREGVRRNFYYRDGSYIHAVLYSVTKPEWSRKQWTPHI